MFQVYPRQAFAVANAVFAPGPIDQNVAHGVSCRREEVVAILPFRIAIAGQAEPRFVNQCCRLERLTRGFPRELVRRQPAQFIINQRQQL